jgi:hypothetical protein
MCTAEELISLESDLVGSRRSDGERSSTLRGVEAVPVLPLYDIMMCRGTGAPVFHSFMLS